MTEAAFKATFADFKIIKTRKVVQVVFEIPIEAADNALQALGGVPQSAEERWCAIARLDLKAAAPTPSTPEKSRKPFRDMSRAQQAGMMCADQRFIKWIDATDSEDAAGIVRRACRVTSRSELDSYAPAGTSWDNLVTKYRQDTGLEANPR